MPYRNKRVARGYTVAMRRAGQVRRSRFKGRSAFGRKGARPGRGTLRRSRAITRRRPRRK